jgi:hypothetical protein
MPRAVGWRLAATLAWVGIQGSVEACDFEYSIDPYTQYFGLDPDYSAYSSDDCAANCCADPSCGVWQYTDMPMGGVANCMHGVSYDYGDSGGIVWTGEEGRQDDPGGGGGDGGGGGRKKKKKCKGLHCDDELDLTPFLIAFGSLAGVYLVSGTYYGRVVQKKTGAAALPHAGFWVELGGLLKDGAAFTLSGGTARGVAPTRLQPYAPIPDAQATPTATVVQGTVQPGGARPGVTFAADLVPKKKKVRVKREKSGRVKKVRPKTSAPSGASSLE